MRPLEVLMCNSPKFEAAKAFIIHGSDVNLRFSNGDTPLLHHLKFENNHLLGHRAPSDIQSWIKEKMQVSWIDLIASRVDNLALKDIHGESALNKTVKYCAWDCTYALLEHGADLWAEEWFLQRQNILDSEAIKAWKEETQQTDEVKDEPYQLRMLDGLYDYFFTQGQMSLKFICKVAIRKHVVEQMNGNFDKLPLPRLPLEYVKNHKV